MDLKAKRDQFGITQQELADLIGLTRQAISAMENGVVPSVENAKKIAEVLGFDWTKFYEQEHVNK